MFGMEVGGNDESWREVSRKAGEDFDPKRQHAEVYMFRTLKTRSWRFLAIVSWKSFLVNPRDPPHLPRQDNP